MERLDWLNRVEWISLQKYEQLQPGIVFEPVELRRALHIIDKHGTVLKGFYAVRKLFLLFPLTFFFGLLMYFPFAAIIGKPAYEWIAANRHKFLKKKCENGSCSLY